MPGLLDLLSNQDILQLIELQRQLGQSPFNQASFHLPRQDLKQWGPPLMWGGPNMPQGQIQEAASRGGMQDPNYNWLQPTPQPPAPPGSSYLPAPSTDSYPVTVSPGDPRYAPPPVRNPRFKTIEDAIYDASIDSPILEDEARKGHSPPMYQPEEFYTDKKRKQRKAV